MVTKAAKELEEEAKKIIDCYLVKIEGEGERVEYKDFEKIIIETIIAYGLEEKHSPKVLKLHSALMELISHACVGIQVLGSKSWTSDQNTQVPIS